MILEISNIMVEGKVINIDLEDSNGYSKFNVLIIHVEEKISFRSNNDIDTKIRPHFLVLPSSLQEALKKPLPP